MKEEIFAWEYNSDSQEYTIPIDTNLQTMDDCKQAVFPIFQRFSDGTSQLAGTGFFIAPAGVFESSNKRMQSDQQTAMRFVGR